MLGLGGGSSSPWLDAGACALLAQESALLQRLVGAAPQFMPASQAQLQEAWTQLWSTAQQVSNIASCMSASRLDKIASCLNVDFTFHAASGAVLAAWLYATYTCILSVYLLLCRLRSC
jgi:hypothetical protein